MGILFGEMGIDWDWEYGAKPRYHVTPGKGKMGVLGDEKRQKAHCYAVCCICCRREKEKAGDAGKIQTRMTAIDGQNGWIDGGSN